jgi:hypothetical protein
LVSGAGWFSGKGGKNWDGVFWPGSGRAAGTDGLETVSGCFCSGAAWAVFGAGLECRVSVEAFVLTNVCFLTGVVLQAVRDKPNKTTEMTAPDILIVDFIDRGFFLINKRFLMLKILIGGMK